MNQLISIVLLAVVAMAAPADAECRKWAADLNVCDVVPSSCLPGAPPWTFSQERYYYTKEFHDDPLEACIASWSYHVTAKNFEKKIVPIDENSVGCYVKWFGQWPTTHDNIIWLDVIQREACCERTPNGPYKDFGTTGIDGGSFSTFKRNKIKYTNEMKNGGTLWSDAHDLIANEFGALIYQLAPWEWENDILYRLMGSPDAANVDHIIPRKDKFGCDCGPNSYANALVISWKLNVSLTNNCQDPRRQMIHDVYTSP